MPRQSAAVYRRRRLAVLVLLLVGVLVVAGGVWLAVAQPWSGSPAPASTAEGEAPPTDDAEPTAAPDDGDAAEDEEPDAEQDPDPSATPGIVACAASDIAVTAVTDADTYPADSLPKLSISLTNKGAEDCTMNVGSSTQEFTVTSGDDRWWSSKDCQSDASDLVVTLTAGKTVTSSEPVVWDRTRSSPETCAEKNRPRAPGGGASYLVRVSIGGFDSERPKQILLR